MAAPSRCAAVVAHIEAVGTFIAAASSGEEAATRREFECKLHSATTRWRLVREEEGIGAPLATDSCEIVVRALRLLRLSLGLSPSEAAMPYASAFLVLAYTLRAFEEACDLPAPESLVSIQGLLSEVGCRLNGMTGTVVRFEPKGGRFIVRLQDADPPAEWKKIRAENLAIQSVSEDAAVRASGARGHGLSCLEAVADIFDDLLVEMQAEALDVQDGSFAQFMQAELATSMWEALACCVGDVGKLRGAGFLELCGSASLCSLLTRYVLSAHLGAHAATLVMAEGKASAAEIRRLRGLQEGIAHVYLGLFEPQAVWKEGFGQANDTPMARLQTDFDAHVQRVAGAGVDIGVLPVFIDAVDFHLSWSCVDDAQHEVPVVLPVLLSRFVCKVITTSSKTGAGVLRRHVQLHSPALIDVLDTFVDLAFSSFASGRADEASGRPGQSSAELMLALRAILDMGVVIAENGFVPGSEAARRLEGVGLNLLGEARTAMDPAVLARLALIFLRHPVTAANLNLTISGLYHGLPEAPRAAFWSQLRGRSRLRRLDAEDAEQEVRQWLGAPSDAPEGAASLCAAAAKVGESEWLEQVNKEMCEIDSLIEKCLRELPQSLQQSDAALPRFISEVGSGAESIAAAAAAPAPPSPTAGGGGLGLRDMPSLPGQLPRDGGAPRRRKQKAPLARADLGKIRGVDASMAPENLRCAIDGKLMATALRSTDGHVFDKESLEQWIATCGSICPVSGKPLRLEDCSEDRAIGREIVEWLRAQKSENKLKMQERREQRKVQKSSTEDLGTEYS